MPFAVSLLSLLIVAQSAPVSDGAFSADDTLALPGGPDVAVFRSTVPRVVSLRLSFSLTEERSEAGAGQILQLLAEDRMLPLAARIGALAEVHRTPQALVYQVSGPTEDLDFLGWILREGVRPPSGEAFESARRRVQSENDRRMETPEGVLATRVRASLAPDNPSVFGTTSSLRRIDPALLAAVWERSHHKRNARLVVVGRVPNELVLAMARDLNLPAESSASALPSGGDPGSTEPPEPLPEVIRDWIVEGYPLLPGDEAAALVVARWLAEYARTDAQDFEIGVEIWELDGGRALVVSAAAYPRSRALMEGRLESLFEDAERLMTEEDVSRLSGELRSGIIMAGRSPWGLAELVGQAWDTGNAPDAVGPLVAELGTLSRVQVIGLVQALGSANPVREEIRP